MPSSSPSFVTRLRRTACILAAAAGSAAVIAVLFNVSSVRTTLRCSRGAAATPPNCQIITAPVWGELQVQDLPNGQLLKAKLATQRSFSAKIFDQTPVILLTTQGEMNFSHQNTPNSGVSYYLDERINTFLQASDAGSLEIDVPDTLASRLIGLLVSLTSVLWLLWLPSALWFTWFPASFTDSNTDSNRPKSDWQQSSERLNHLLQPPPQQIDLDDRQD